METDHFLKQKKELNTKITIILILYVLIAIVVIGLCAMLCHEKGKNELIKTDTIVMYHRDTILIEKPTERTRYIYKYVTDTLYSVDSVPVAVTVPISVSQYSDTAITKNKDSIIYSAYLSGYKAQLDSLQFQVMNNETHIIIQKPCKKWSCGIGVGVFSGVTYPGTPTTGIGITIGIQRKFTHSER